MAEGWGEAAITKIKERIILNSDITESWGVSFEGVEEKVKDFHYVNDLFFLWVLERAHMTDYLIGA